MTLFANQQKPTTSLGVYPGSGVAQGGTQGKLTSVFNGAGGTIAGGSNPYGSQPGAGQLGKAVTPNQQYDARTESDKMRASQAAWGNMWGQGSPDFYQIQNFLQGWQQSNPDSVFDMGNYAQQYQDLVQQKKAEYQRLKLMGTSDYLGGVAQLGLEHSKRQNPLFMKLAELQADIDPRTPGVQTPYQVEARGIRDQGLHRGYANRAGLASRGMGRSGARRVMDAENRELVSKTLFEKDKEKGMLAQNRLQGDVDFNEMQLEGEKAQLYDAVHNKNINAILQEMNSPTNDGAWWKTFAPVGTPATPPANPVANPPATPPSTPPAPGMPLDPSPDPEPGNVVPDAPIQLNSTMFNKIGKTAAAAKQAGVAGMKIQLPGLGEWYIGAGGSYAPTRSNPIRDEWLKQNKA